jgi:hypothetical protein
MEAASIVHTTALIAVLYNLYFIECNKTIYMYKEKSPGVGHCALIAQVKINYINNL